MGDEKGTTVSSVWRTLCIVIVLGVFALAGLLAYKLFEDPAHDPLYDEYPPNYTATDLKTVQPDAR